MSSSEPERPAPAPGAQRPMLKKAIMRPLAKVRLDLDAEGVITPVQLRLDPEGEAVGVAQVERVSERVSERWFEVLTTEGERWVLRFRPEELSFFLHSVETQTPERWRGWSEGGVGASAVEEQEPGEA